ncbi:hypothetical protein QFC21_006687 [Naganishia friedmannii]|uniref:Uncharacterized protein n=1 Tax=Naganishia friedmannii TaxID=89922 RepID=A0ACC2V1B6_9TREE|nr:hypothetical protein QFC21_006687 [Naganishia friedmannii]
MDGFLRPQFRLDNFVPGWSSDHPWAQQTVPTEGSQTPFHSILTGHSSAMSVSSVVDLTKTTIFESGLCVPLEGNEGQGLPVQGLTPGYITGVDSNGTTRRIKGKMPENEGDTVVELARQLQGFVTSSLPDWEKSSHIQRGSRATFSGLGKQNAGCQSGQN